MHTTSAPRRTGFTLTELLVVIAIIALLIGIVVPTVGAARRAANRASTQATFATLDVGIQQFQADGKVGGGLPPSASDERVPGGNPNSGLGASFVANPYSTIQPPIPTDRSFDSTPMIHVAGANLLYFALAGADSLGTVGFKVLRTNNTEGHWSHDQSDSPGGGYTAGVAGGYTLRQADGQPVYTRSGPYVDLSKVRHTVFNPSGRLSGNGTQVSFEIPAEVQATKAANVDTPRRRAPMFLDAFGFPILYWKADSAGRAAAAASREVNGLLNGQFTGNQNQSGIYNFSDNATMVSPVASSQNYKPLQLTRALDPHKLSWTTTVADPRPTQGNQNVPQFWAFIQDPGVTAKATPHRPDSYLLLSPGPDGIYGSGDDIANFDHNGS